MGATASLILQLKSPLPEGGGPTRSRELPRAQRAADCTAQGSQSIYSGRAGSGEPVSETVWKQPLKRSLQALWRVNKTR